MKPGPLAAGIALAIFVVLRRRKLEPTLVVGGLLGAIGFVVYGSGLVELPDVEQLIEDAGELFGKWTYLVVPVLAFLETGAFVGLITPGETFMVFGGVVAGQGRISLVTLIGLVWLAAVAGDVASFYLGRRLGRPFLEKHGRKVQITPERLEHVDRFYARHGGKAILLGRFVGLVRAVSPFLAGSGGMRFSRFLPYDVIGAGLWATAFLVLGYVFWQSFGDVLHYAERGAFALGTTIVVVVAAVWLRRKLKDEEGRQEVRAWLHEQAERPVLRPVAAAARPVVRRARRPARFVWGRITPGDLGLEVTTLLAVLSVATYAFLSPLLAIDEGRMPTGDRDVLRWADDLRTATLVDVAQVVSDVGSFAVVGGIVLVVAFALVFWRRDVLSATALVLGTVLTKVLVDVVKDGEARARPDGGFVDTDSFAYPSGHAANGVILVAVAVVVQRAVHGKLKTAALVVATIAFAAAVGLSRIVLRVHWLSDVTGGFGLAAGIFCLVGLGALVVGHLRHTPRTPA